MHRVVVVSGHSRTGKTSLGELLEKQFQFYRIKTSTIVRDYAVQNRRSRDRKGLQALGDEFDETFGDDWLFRYVQDVIQVLDEAGHDDRDIIIDSVRTWEQLAPFRACQSIKLVHVH